MRCEEFERWLDEGMPGEGTRDASEHAESCDACARAWAAAREVERFFAMPPAPAPAGLAAAAMARVERVRRMRPAAARADAPALPWWIGAAGDRRCVLALLVAAVAALWLERVLPAVRALLAALTASAQHGAAAEAAGAVAAAARSLAAAGAEVAATMPVASSGAGATASPAILAGLLPAVILASFAIYRWAQSRMTR
jgi:hypothetical protein